MVNGNAYTPAAVLHDLRLDAARALLGEDTVSALPSFHTNGIHHLQGIIDGLCDLSLRDPLTGCANRRQFEQVLEGELDRVARSGDIALLLMIDVDHFKQVNDTHGHAAGDLVLQNVAAALHTCIRPMDTLARYGGEEFAVVLPACQYAYGHNVAERLRSAVEDLRIAINPVESIRVTASIGGAYALQWIRSTSTLWIERTDQQLYIAKHGGRNRVAIEPQPDSTVSAEEKNLLFIPDLLHSHAWDDEAASLISSTNLTDGVN